MAVSKRTRFEVLKRDGNACRYCGVKAAETGPSGLTIDHVIPVALGGSDDPANLVAACKDCNAGKSSSSPDAGTVAQVSDDTVRWAAAMKLAAERLASNKAAVADELRPWFDWWEMRSGPGWSYKLPEGADKVLTGYLAAGMPLPVLVDALHVTMAARNIDNRFRYFQGVANNMLAELQRDAVAILATEEATQAPRARCPVCHYPHEDVCGFQWGWRVGITDCPVMHTDTTRGESGHPDHYLMMALSRVVDAPAHEWAATWPYPSELYPMYTGRTASGS